MPHHSAFLIPASHARRQQGAALMVALVLLVVLTMMSLAIVRSTRTQMIGGASTQLAAESLAAAENAVTVAERRVLTEFNGIPTFDFDAGTADGLYNVGTVAVTSTDWSGLGHESTAGNQYIVEYLGPAPAPGGSIATGGGGFSDRCYLFRTTGRGTSSKGSVRIVQTIVATAE